MESDTEGAHPGESGASAASNNDHQGAMGTSQGAMGDSNYGNNGNSNNDGSSNSHGNGDGRESDGNREQQPSPRPYLPCTILLATDRPAAQLRLTRDLRERGCHVIIADHRPDSSNQNSASSFSARYYDDDDDDDNYDECTNITASLYSF